MSTLDQERRDLAVVAAAFAALPSRYDPIAIVPAGSDLYRTKRAQHDFDAIAVTAGGRAAQKMIGDLDLRIIPLEDLLAHASNGSLTDCEVLFALEAGHGAWFNSPFTPMLRGARAPLGRYADTTRRFAKSRNAKAKHTIRHELVLRRAWDTGNTDPRLSDAERAEYLERLAAAEETAA